MNQLYPPSIVIAILDGLFCSTAFNASSRSNSCNLIHRIGLLGLGYRKASSCEERNKWRKTATSIHCSIGIRNQDPSTQGEEWLPRKPDPAPCDLLMCGSANESLPRKIQEHKMNCNTWLEIFLRCSFWRLKQSVQPADCRSLCKILGPMLKSDVMTLCLHMVQELSAYRIPFRTLDHTTSRIYCSHHPLYCQVVFVVL